MASRTFAVHAPEENIKRVDDWARQLRRSRSSLLNEAIEMLLEHYDGDKLKQMRAGLNDLHAGRVIPHEKAMNNARKQLSKFKKKTAAQKAGKK